MTSRRLAGATALLSLMLAVAGCAGSSAPGARSPKASAPVAIPLATGVASPGGSWAIVQTGGPSAGGRFWQLVALDQASGKWRLVTPPGVADNAGLAVTRAPDGTLTAGFLPGQLLKFSPLAMSTDDGAHWVQALLPAGLVHDPDSLASLPDGRLVAVTATGAEESAAGARTWAPLVTLRALAATPDGRRCGLTGLTGAAAGLGGSVLISGTCGRDGQLGLFSNASGGWHAAGLLVSSQRPVRDLLGRTDVKSMTMLGLVSSAAGVSALVDVDTSRGQTLIPAWLAAGSKTWASYALSGTLGGTVASVSGSASGAWVVTLNGGQAAVASTAAGPPGAIAPTWGNSFRAPGANATIVPSGDGAFTALVPGVSAITVWQRTASGSWHRTQVIDVASAPAGQSS